MSLLEKKLISAADAGDLDGVRAALAAGVDVNAEGGDALRRAAMHGHMAVFEFLIAAGANNYTEALMSAADDGRLAVVELLIARGADVHAFNNYALCRAASRGHVAVAECLIRHGADVNAGSGMPLRLAADLEQIPALLVLRTAGASLAPLATTFGTLSAAAQTALLSVGDIDGVTPIELAEQGAYGEAICVVLARQGQAPLANMIIATRALSGLSPKEMAMTLRKLLADSPSLENQSAIPGL